MSHSVKPRRQVPVYTLRDFKRDEQHRQYLIERTVLESKVRHWEKRAEQFGGEIHIATLEKFRSQLAAL